MNEPLSERFQDQDIYISVTFQVLMFSHPLKSTLNGASGGVLSIV